MSKARTIGAVKRRPHYQDRAARRWKKQEREKRWKTESVKSAAGITPQWTAPDDAEAAALRSLQPTPGSITGI